MTALGGRRYLREPAGKEEGIMTIETKPWNAAELLETPADIAAYLDAYLEDGTTEELLGALNTIARSRGMSALARDTGISREALYRAFSDNDNRSSIPCCER